jgi:hypothetical protein
MANVKLQKASIKDGMFLTVKYEETTATSTDTYTRECTSIIHDDLKEAFSRLSPHIEDICELSNHEHVKAKGFTIGGAGDHEGVCIIGSSDLTMGTLNLVTPFVKWDSDYENISELGEIIDDCKNEVIAYLFEDKHAPEAQQKLEFEDEQ